MVLCYTYMSILYQTIAEQWHVTIHKLNILFHYFLEELFIMWRYRQSSVTLTVPKIENYSEKEYPNYGISGSHIGAYEDSILP